MATVEPHARAEVERLYCEYGERVYAICFSILRDRQEAEDAAQQVFVSALRALGGGAVPLDAPAWLATIARHESWARDGRQPTAPLHEGLEDRAQEDPATAVVRRAVLDEAWHGIAALPASQREALLLRTVRGLAYDEVAADLRLSRASVRSLLSRARRTLRMQVERGAAALTGAQWLNALSRLVADTSSPAVSSATRTGAVGLGALAITGGALIGPTLTQHARARVAVHPAATPRVQRAAARPALIGASVSSAPRTRPGQANLVPPDRADRTGDRRHRGEGGGAGRDRHRGGGQDDGAMTLVSASGSSGGDGPGSPTSGRDSSGSDGSSGSGPGPSGSNNAANAPSAVAVFGTSGKGSSGGGSGSSGGSGSRSSSGGSATAVAPPALDGSSGDGSGGSSGSGGSDSSGSGGSDGSGGSGSSGDGH